MPSPAQVVSTNGKPRPFNIKREETIQVFATSVWEARRYERLNWGVILESKVTNTHRAGAYRL